MNKSEARRVARQRLRSADPSRLQDAAQEIAEHLWTVPEISGAGTILLYAALPREVPTGEIAVRARESGMEVVYPRCIDAVRLSLHRVGQESSLRDDGRFGIPEPGPECPVVSAEEIDAALIPGLAWSRGGHRLGRGAGYFDRLLSSPGWRGFRCGVFLSLQEMPDLPLDHWDVPLDAIVTERGVIRI
ncbi:5-formyltetrahydrofolate cyclo-ligase [soil metagenome]